MKTKPQDGYRAVFAKSSADKMDFCDAIERYRSNPAQPKTGITFVGSEDEFEKLSNFPTSNFYRVRYCSSLPLLLRSGLYQESDVFVLTSSTHVAEQADVERILSARSDKKIKVIALRETTAKDWTCDLDSAIEEIELWAAKRSITNDILERSPKLAATDKKDGYGSETKLPVDLRAKSAKETWSEEEFKEVIAHKLNQHLDSSPENILSKAIDVIKR